MKKYKYFSGLVSAAAVLSLSVLLAACGGGSAEKAGESPEQEAQEASAEQAGDAGGDAAADTGGAVSGKKEAPAGEGMAQKKGDSAGQQEQGKTLAERLAGRYSYEYPPAEDDAERMDEDMTEYYTLDIVNFGGNLFATGGIAMCEEGEEKVPYSFWGMELIPVEEGALLDREADSCEVGILAFSVMSNLGEYWDRPEYSIISLTENGVAFRGKDGKDNPLIEGSKQIEFVKDDSVEPSLEGHVEALPEEGREEIPEELYGIWREEDSDAPLVAEIAKDDADGIGRVYFYRKNGGQRVTFCAGHFYAQEDSSLYLVYDQLGFIPYQERWEYSLGSDGKTLELCSPDEWDTLSGLGPEKVSFARIQEEDIPTTGPYALENADTSLLAYRSVLDLYSRALEEGWDEETMRKNELYSVLPQHGWAPGDADSAGYFKYDIDGNGIDELMITLYGNVVEIYGFDGKKAVYSYGCPYRGETIIYDDGMVEMLFGTMTRASNTWYRQNAKTGYLLPVTEREYVPVDHGEPDMQYYIYEVEGNWDIFEEEYEKSGGNFPVWAGEWGDIITESEYESLISHGNPVELPEPVPLKSWAGF